MQAAQIKLADSAAKEVLESNQENEWLSVCTLTLLQPWGLEGLMKAR